MFMKWCIHFVVCDHRTTIVCGEYPCHAENNLFNAVINVVSNTIRHILHELRVT